MKIQGGRPLKRNTCGRPNLAARMGWGSFDYDAASDTFSPATEAATPPQGHDATCGFACHTLAKSRDYVFTEYAHR